MHPDECSGCADAVINIGSSKYARQRIEKRYDFFAGMAYRLGTDVVFVNQVGANTDVIYDGSSAVFSAEGKPLALLAGFEEDYRVVELGGVHEPMEVPYQDKTRNVYRAIKLGLADFFRKNGYSRACLGLSGGIDSPVAGYMIAKRGVEIECIHFFSYPYTSELAKEKVLELAHIMTKFCGRMTVDIVGFTEIQEAIRDHCREEYFTIIMRRFMMRIAEAIGRDHGAKCLVTGENLGQVASQTMDAMAVTGAVVHMPIFHPLIGMDKEEIVTVARRIGTLDTSILPYEDCCTVFTPKHPKTKPVLAQVEAEEQKLDVEGLIARAIANTEKTQIRYYEDEHRG